MWNRSGLKSNAKENLKRYYWVAFGICIITSIFNGGGGSGATLRYGDGGFGDSIKHNYDYGVDMALLSTIAMSVFAAMFVFFVVGLLLQIFVGNILIVGKNRFFMEARDYETGFGAIGFGFKNGNFGKVALTMFLMNLFISLWSLLFIIPGIIKAYEYAMIPYIIAENPDIDRKRAFEISKEMMRGEKFNYFVLQISFIGWILLGTLACCIGVVFVTPYLEATYAEFYGWAREKVLSSGAAGGSELIGFGTVQM